MQEQKWYYCTKTTRFPLSDVVNAINSLFKKKKVKTLSFNNVYEYLKQYFNVKSFNRNNLSVLLGKSVFVSVDTVTLLLEEYNTEKKGILDFLYDLFFRYSIKVKNVMNILNYDTLVKLIDCEFESLNPLLDSMKLSYKTFDDNDKIILKKWLNFYPYAQWSTILSNQTTLGDNLNKIQESLHLEYEEKCFLDEILFLFKEIHKDNYPARIKYLMPFGDIFNKHGIYNVEDISKMDLSAAKELFLFKNDILNGLKSLQLSVLVNFSNEYSQYVQKVNKKHEPHSLWEKYVTILTNRANGETLESSGKYYQLTRERVRQLENEYIERFNDLITNVIPHCINQIRAFTSDENFICNKDFRILFKFNPQIFKYMLQLSDVKNVEYIEEIDKFYYIDDYDWYKELLSFSETLPNRFSVNELSYYIDKGLKILQNNGFKLTDSDCLKIILRDYKHIGNEYSRYKISLAEKFKHIMRTYYQGAVDIYDKKFLEEFRNHFSEVYPNDILKTNRATTAILARIGLLVGRGLYVLNDHYFMSEELSNKIYDYIVKTNREIYLTNNIFSLFEKELQNEGIDNKYFMQGALKQRIEGKVYFRRDYISLNPNITSTYGEIYNFIKNAKRVVSYSEIEKEFFGITWSVIQFSVSQEGLLNYRKKYIHYDNLSLTEDDICFLNRTIEFFVQNNEIHHTSELYEFIQNNNENLLKKLFIENQFGLFSLLMFLFEDKYEFKRPFIAKKGIVIENQNERIKEFISSFDELEIDSLMDFVYSNKLHIYSIVELVDSLENYVFKDDRTLINIDKTNLNKDVVLIVEDKLNKLLLKQDFIYADAVDFTDFPMGVSWTSWLLYSSINKFGNMLKAIPSDNKFKFKNLKISRPVIIKKNIAIKVLTEYTDYIGNKIAK